MAYEFVPHSRYFWRTYTGAELDCIEEKEGQLSAFEFKSGKKKRREPKSWKETYPDSTYEYINQENYLEFIL